MDRSRLNARTQHLLRSRPRTLTYDKIAVDTGIDIHWIKSFGTRAGPRDSLCDRVQTLWEYLTGRKLDIDYPLSSDHYN